MDTNPKDPMENAKEASIPTDTKIIGGGFSKLTQVVLRWLGVAPQQSTPSQHIKRRVHELKRIAQEVLFQLQEVEEDVKRGGDQELSTYVEQVVEPMIRDVNRIHRMTEKEGVAESQQVQLLEKYSQWISTAKPWVHFFSTQGHDKEAISKAVVSQSIHISEELIDKDIQVIRDYQNHKFGEVQITEEQKGALKVRMEAVLEEPLMRLNALRRTPANLTVEQLEEWKSETNMQREECYNDALHKVDQMVQELAVQGQLPHHEEMREHQILNFEELADLEDSLPQLLEMVNQEEITPKMGQKIKDTLITLEAEAHELEQELLLTPELFQRLQRVKLGLQWARQQLWPRRVKYLGADAESALDKRGQSISSGDEQ